MQKMIPLKNLRFGEEHDPPLNVRKTGREVRAKELADSIHEIGMGQALNVVGQKHLGFVEDGNRRLRALRILEERGNITGDTLIKCEVGEKAGLKAGELGLALNVHREAMHPADEYEHFWRLHEQGMTDEQIAIRYGYDKKQVRKVLALGHVARVILDAWREGKGRFESEGFEIVAAFTLAPNVKEQIAVFKRLQKAGRIWPQPVRAAFGAGNGEIAKNLGLVGKVEYEKAGGKVTEDLFGDNHAVSDPPLLAKLAGAKIKEKLIGLTKDGWAWASLSTDLPYGWDYSWQKVKGGAAASKEDKAKAGCAVVLGNDGLKITYGLMKPDVAKKERAAAAREQAKAEGKPAEKAVPVVSDALINRLSLQLTRSVQTALAASPQIALAALLTGLDCRESGTPVRIRKEGVGEYETRRDSEPFKAVLKRYAAMSLDDLLKAVAPAMSGAVTLQSFNKNSPPLNIPPYVGLIELLDPPAFTAAMKAQFDAADYFASVAKPLIITAITEAVNADEARKADKLKKGDLVKFAIENVAKTGWLPPELRTAHYSGPGAKKPAAKTAAKAPKLKKAA
jgi:ParB family chromosome partitioning protein